MSRAVFMNALWVDMSLSHGVISTCPFQSPRRTFEESVKKREAQRGSSTRTLLKKKQKTIFLSQWRLYEYIEACLQWNQWSIEIIQKTSVKWIDEHGSYWIKIFLHFNVLFTFGRNWCSKALQIQCSSVSTGSSILLIPLRVKWIGPHTRGAVRIMLTVRLDWEWCMAGPWASGVWLQGQLLPHFGWQCPVYYQL